MKRVLNYLKMWVVGLLGCIACMVLIIGLDISLQWLVPRINWPIVVTCVLFVAGPLIVGRIMLDLFTEDEPWE